MNMTPTEVEREPRRVLRARRGGALQAIGVVHGGFMATLLDSVAGCGFTTLALGEATTLTWK